MSVSNDLLIELGTEELPPKALKKLMSAFAEGISKGLATHDLAHQGITPYATPRRLAVKISGLVTQQADKSVERKGPAIKAARDAEGNPSKAAEGFARSCGVSFDELQTLETEKGAWLVFRSTQQGKQTASLIPEIIEQSLNKLPIPKRMTWGAHKDAFVRPVHWLVVLFGNDVVQCNILGKAAGNESRGHRFHAPAVFTITSPGDYESQLKERFVIADYDQRQSQILEGVKTIASSTTGTPSIDNDLLHEVTGLVEWPVPLIGNFEEDFLQVPQEALISAMQEHQKYFPVLDSNGKILPHFITVSNIESSDPSQVINGNERVIRPRLSDARFFFETDKKKSLEQHNEPLSKIVFEAQLGTLLEKSARVSTLAKYIAERIGGNEEWAARAGLLCKADLSTEMVGEFPDLQGIIGTYYAANDGEAEEVGLALNEQYQPRFSGDKLPSTLTGAAVAIADKVDTLVGILGIGKKPTGDKDPYALRRAALGVLRIIVGKKLPLDLVELFQQSSTLYADKLTNAHVKEDYLEFLQGRYMSWFQEEGFSTDIVKAVLGVNPTAPLDFYQRIEAVKAFKALPASEALAAANKRVGNILGKREDTSELPAVSEALLEAEEEKRLFTIVAQKSADMQSSGSKNYTKVLSSLAELKDPVDAFFDNVMVNVEEPALKNNRLALLQELHGLFLDIADISVLQ
ncbi:glycine--tRNA ligase subunit beta [Gammaproteobacteria bacterium 45_16_T64]|nr:glycine--tRNA ligase subunit beta [Gammaproteobacteria bacterium 45_16_T64]